MNGEQEKKDDGVRDRNEKQQYQVLMWGYFPGVTAQRSPLSSPASVRFPEVELVGDSWKDVCSGGCGFGLAISAFGKLITWGSADDQGQSYLASGRHGEVPNPYPLPISNPIVNAAAGWAHCVSVTDKGELYTWGWKECVPSGKVSRSWTSMMSGEDEILMKQISAITDQGNPQSHNSKPATESISCPDDKISGDDNMKRRKVSTQQELETSIPADETLSMLPCLVNLDPGVKITSVAAGGRHTLVLSDAGQVWGWGYGGEGQLGLGSRIKMLASPHLIPCFELSSSRRVGSSAFSESAGSEQHKSMGSYVKRIACGGRHSVVVTDAGVLLAFGWGLYGQCGQGTSDDVLQPTCVPSLLGTEIEAVGAGLWHTICICSSGRVYAFGGNQFGQLGLGTSLDQCEMIPRMLDAAVVENKKAKVGCCGARHSAILTEEGEIFSWGWNKYGQLGLGDSIDRNIPAQVPLRDYVAKNICCGWWHTLAFGHSLSPC